MNAQSWKSMGLIAVMIPTLTLAQHKNKKHDEVPAAFQYAHFIYVQAADGDVMKPGVFPADRQAIYDVQDSIKDWNRYTVVLHREQADIILMVRKGRIAQARAGVSVGSRLPGSASPTGPAGSAGSNRGQDPIDQPGNGAGTSAEVGPENDTLRVYLPSGDGKLAGPVWSRELEDGLEAPDVMLMQQLRTAVEHTYPSQPPAAKQTTP